MKHTPGPWGYSFFTTGADEKDRTDCFITQRSMKTDNDVDLIATVYKISDARLISAAPEMYEMLNKLRMEMDNLSFNLHTERDIEYAEDTRDSIHALLRRIDGEEGTNA